MTQPERASGDTFAALGDSTRRAILEVIGEGPVSVQEIADRLPVSRPAVSKHLRLLCEAGLVTGSREGVRHVFRLNDEGLDIAEEYFRRVWGERAARFRLVAENTAEDR